MTITGLYTQNLTLSLNTSSSSASLPTPVVGDQKTGAGAPATAAAAAPGADTVSISAQAIRMQTVVVTLTTAPAESSPTQSQGTARGDALFDALDADGDGTVTKEEFVNGARELLQNSRRHGRSHGPHRGDGLEHGDRHDRDNSRLNRRLERLFDRVDADGDGGIQKAEIAGALQRTRPLPTTPQATSAPEQPGPVASAIVEPTSRTEPPQPDATQSPVIAQAAVPAAADAAPGAATEQRQAGVSDAAPAEPFVTIARITITIAIQQYSAVNTDGSATPSTTLRAAA